LLPVGVRWLLLLGGTLSICLLFVREFGLCEFVGAFAEFEFADSLNLLYISKIEFHEPFQDASGVGIGGKGFSLWLERYILCEPNDGIPSNVRIIIELDVPPRGFLTWSHGCIGGRLHALNLADSKLFDLLAAGDQFDFRFLTVVRHYE
jgi:hypothetical protein